MFGLYARFVTLGGTLVTNEIKKMSINLLGTRRQFGQFPPSLAGIPLYANIRLPFNGSLVRP